MVVAITSERTAIPRCYHRGVLPYLTAELPGTGGVLRASPEDFVVAEIPAYAPSGTGDHTFVRIEKRGLTTAQAIDRIARAVDTSPRDVGCAGMKDRHAITRQWISVMVPPERLLALGWDDLRVLEAHRHAHKLRTGHLRGNRFVLRVRDADPDAPARAAAILARLAMPPGAPNWYGEQRFGKDGDNAARGRAIVLGEAPAPRDKRLAKLLVSALQSELFNAWLAARMRDGLYARALAGDVLHKLGGGLFTCDDADTETARLLAGELAITGPMFGSRMRAADRDAGVREVAILGDLDPSRFPRALGEGTRRDATIVVGEPSVTAIAAGEPEQGIEVAFTLPSGAYATAVMREVMKC
jgi:tRNA pseudouridine13 synthase